MRLRLPTTVPQLPFLKPPTSPAISTSRPPASSSVVHRLHHQCYRQLSFKLRAQAASATKAARNTIPQSVIAGNLTTMAATHPNEAHINTTAEHTANSQNGTSEISPEAAEAAMQDYRFPTHRLKRMMNDSTKTPLVLVSCGSFSPITFLHLRMFEMAKDYLRFSKDEFELVGAYLSPVSDAYKKVGLAPARHRIAMCQLAVEEGSDWIMVDPWEASRAEYTPTAIVLDHFNKELNELHGGIETYTGEKKKIHVMLLAGADLIQTMSAPGVWAPKDLDHILGDYGCFIIERSGTDIDEALSTLQKWKDNIHVIQQLIQNDVSSTKIRLFLRRDMSIRYLVPAPAIKYIEQHGLYEDGDNSSQHEKEWKDKAAAAGEGSSGASGKETAAA